MSQATSASKAGDLTAIVEKIARLLEIVVRVELSSLKAEQSQNDMISMLDSLGCGQSEIADLLGTTSKTVNSSLYKAKHKNKKK